MDTSYGTNSALRAGIGAQALTYVAAILPTVKVRAVGDPDRRVSAKQLVLSLPNHTWRTITWGDGSAESAALALCPRAGAHHADRGRRHMPGRHVADRVAALPRQSIQSGFAPVVHGTSAPSSVKLPYPGHAPARSTAVHIAEETPGHSFRRTERERTQTNLMKKC